MTKELPTHVGLILDGNRRWAKANNLPSLNGHKVGYDNFYKIGKYLLIEKKIPYVSAYVFSTENWSRSVKEVNYLMKLVSKALNDFLDDFHEAGIKIVVLGSRDKLKKSVLTAIQKAETTTKNNKKGNLVLCFNYGGQQEISDAVKKIITDKIPTERIEPELVGKYIYSPEIPDVDLIIRTSGEHRLSGYMLWRSVYSEFYFSNKFWPDFTTDDTDLALNDFANRHRRFGA